jgi:uncharacterized membrane protein YjfL (UPF0719 family)
VLCLLGMALIAAFYLRRRELSLSAYLSWGLLIILVPLLGPFLVIYYQPGLSKKYIFGLTDHHL